MPSNVYNLDPGLVEQLDEGVIAVLQQLLADFIKQLNNAVEERKKRKRSTSTPVQSSSQLTPLQKARKEYYKQIAHAKRSLMQAMPSPVPAAAAAAPTPTRPSPATFASTPPMQKAPFSPTPSPRRQRAAAIGQPLNTAWHDKNDKKIQGRKKEAGQLTIRDCDQFAVQRSPRILHTPAVVVRNPYKKARVVPSKSVTPPSTKTAAATSTPGQYAPGFHPPPSPSTPKTKVKNPYLKESTTEVEAEASITSAEKDYLIYTAWEEEDEAAAIASAEQVDAATSLQFLARSTPRAQPPAESSLTNNDDHGNSTDNNEESQPLKSAEDGDYYSHLV